ncbi:hypothetical protein COCCADRAFT_21750 [Bipolaris zeicola 26-R-13]|uniref:Uncharacterized protein n=1 Tax=Cochliobolus carbonum (strain 26-R-13) TaxID=930089 RepID=W6YI77_COCC2|nr:uncharacterized protein COCCADRAFT_21750 [Bipolaris zeicola 26-R-13]EUC39022.1 hypothetical protein COCCADRAFT_21750 [Bipolaris zeicola 26-R-13]
MAGMNLIKKFHPLCDVPAFGGLRHVSGLPPSHATGAVVVMAQRTMASWHTTKEKVRMRSSATVWGHLANDTGPADRGAGRQYCTHREAQAIAHFGMVATAIRPSGETGSIANENAWLSNKNLAAVSAPLRPLVWSRNPNACW